MDGSETEGSFGSGTSTLENSCEGYETIEEKGLFFDDVLQLKRFRIQRSIRKLWGSFCFHADDQGDDTFPDAAKMQQGAKAAEVADAEFSSQLPPENLKHTQSIEEVPSKFRAIFFRHDFRKSLRKVRGSREMVSDRAAANTHGDDESPYHSCRETSFEDEEDDWCSQLALELGEIFSTISEDDIEDSDAEGGEKFLFGVRSADFAVKRTVDLHSRRRTSG